MSQILLRDFIILKFSHQNIKMEISLNNISTLMRKKNRTDKDFELKDIRIRIKDQ